MQAKNGEKTKANKFVRTIHQARDLATQRTADELRAGENRVIEGVTLQKLDHPGEPEGDTPKYKIPNNGKEPAKTYRLIHDELELNAKPTLNLATFVNTWMEDEAKKLAADSIDVNLIDREIYPMTTEIQKRIIYMVAHLLHADFDPDNADEDTYIGSATVGSSEAVMLGVLAHKTRWLEWYDKLRAEHKPEDGRVPNLVIGGAYQVCWEKVYKFFDIAGLDGYKDQDPKKVFKFEDYDKKVDPRERLRIIPLEKGKRVVTAEDIKKCIDKGIIDENTVAVGLVLGTTLTGEIDEIKEINKILQEYNDEQAEKMKKRGIKDPYRVPIHVDAAYGGFVLAFTEPGMEWDFRLSEVKSINMSNHKFGLVYPGLGTVVFRDPEVVPKSLFTKVNYLGGIIKDYALNFSRASWQVICQYYNFIRLGKKGYTAVMEGIMSNATKLVAGITGDNKLKQYFTLFTSRDKGDKLLLPNVVFQVNESDFTADDLSARLRQDGWSVPAYTLPANQKDVKVIRMVVKESFSRDMVDLFINSMKTAVKDLTSDEKPGKVSEKIKLDGAHTVC